MKNSHVSNIVNSNINIIQQINPAALSITKGCHSQKFGFTKVNTPLVETIAQSHKLYLSTMRLFLRKGKLETSWVLWWTLPNTDQLSCTVQHISLWNKHRWWFYFCPAQVKNKLVLANGTKIRNRKLIIFKIFFFSTKNPTVHWNYKGLLDLTITMLVFC